MSSTKKKNKTHWQKAQTDLIQISGVRNFSWAEEVENEAEEVFDSKPLNLPTAPRASCMVTVDESKIPLTPPFQVHVSNLPYDLTDGELRGLFPNSQIKEVRIPKEERGNKAKGYGYVEFDDRASLVAALHLTGLSLRSRVIRIELATSDSGRGGGRNRGNQRSDSGPVNLSSVDRTAGNWRSGPREDDQAYDRAPRREYGQGFSRREESFHDRERSDRYTPRDRDRGFRDREDRDRRSYEDWNRDRGRDDRDRRFREPRRDEPPPRVDTEPKNRPKLNLQPRSSNLPPPAASNEPATSNSIFGNAKPVDTSAKLREIEERLANEILSEKSRSGGSSTGSSGGPASAPGPARTPSSDKKLEPAQPPKENAWVKSRSFQLQEKRANRQDDKKDI